jgi:hypothetical protein
MPSYLRYYWYTTNAINSYDYIDWSYDGVVNLDSSYIGKTVYCVAVPYFSGSWQWGNTARSSDITIAGRAGNADGGIRQQQRRFHRLHRRDLRRQFGAGGQQLLYVRGALPRHRQAQRHERRGRRGRSTTVLRYLNLSRPEITLGSKPADYQMTAASPTA